MKDLPPDLKEEAYEKGSKGRFLEQYIDCVADKNRKNPNAGDGIRLFYRAVWSIALIGYLYQYSAELFYGCIKAKSGISDNPAAAFHDSDCNSEPDCGTAD